MSVLTNGVAPKKRSSQDNWNFRKLDAQILSQLSAALVLFKMKTGHNGKYAVNPLNFDNNWKIVQKQPEKNNTMLRSDDLGPTDIIGHIENIHILDIKKALFDLIENGEDTQGNLISQDNQSSFKNSISSFIDNKFVLTRKKLEREKDDGTISMHKKFRQYYTKKVYGDIKYALNYVDNYSKNKLSKNTYDEFLAQKTIASNFKNNLEEQKDRKIYRDIYLTLANLLYEKNHAFLDDNGQINDQGIKHIAQVFALTISNIPISGASQSFYKIFHDGDFSFLKENDQNGEPVIGLLEHYVEVIKYLLDGDSFNAYNEGGEFGGIEWSRSKKTFLNNLFSDATYEKKEKKITIGERWNSHNKLSEIWNSTVKSLSSKDWEPVQRLKSDHSTLQKISSKTPYVNDESGLRMTYYGQDYKTNQTQINTDISSVSSTYLNSVINVAGVSIKTISADKKGTFLSDDDYTTLLKHLSQIVGFDLKQRVKVEQTQVTLEQIKSIYFHFQRQTLPESFSDLYLIANGGVKRGSNGDYADVKLMLQYEIAPSFFEKKDGTSIDLTQEISFYPYSNDFGLANHRILDLEKKLFNRVQSMNDLVLGKTISLHRLRYFTETALKQMSFDIDVYEDKITKGLLPYPQNDDYRYIDIDGERVSLKNMIYRNKSNDVTFDRLICYIINMFLQTNKILFISKDDPDFSPGFLQKDLLRSIPDAKKTRFLTYSVLKTMAQDPKNNTVLVHFYSPINNIFETVSLGDFADILFLAKSVKKK